MIRKIKKRVKMCECENILKDKVHDFVVKTNENYIIYAQKIFDLTNEYLDNLDNDFDKLKEEFCPELLPKKMRDENGESELIKNSEIDLSSLGNIISNSTTALTDEISKNPTLAVEDGMAKTDEVPQG